MVKLIIFDFDGTLGDTRKNIIMTMQQTMRELGLAVADEARCVSTIGLPLQACFQQIYPTLPVERIEQCASVYRQIFEENKKRIKPSLFPHVYETLQTLYQQGILLAVASSRNSKSLNGFLDEMEIAEYISYVVGADGVTHAKPEPEAVLKILDALDIAVVDALVVGDMPVDVMMGARAGVRTCGVSYGNATSEELAKAGANYIIDDMSELLSIIPTL